MDNKPINFKQFLWMKTKSFLWSFVKFAALNLFRALVIIVGYAFYIIRVMAEWLLILTAFIGRGVGVNFSNVVINDVFQAQEEQGSEQFQQKFSKDDINELAGDVDPDATIKQIEQDLGVSYRQARKIKMAAKSSPTVNNFTVAQLSA